MKIKKTVLEQIIREEIAVQAKRLLEAKTEVDDAEQDGKKKDKADGKQQAAPQKQPNNTAKAPEKDTAPPPAKEPKDPKDATPPGEEDDDADDEPENAEEAESKLADGLAGKTVQSITAEPKSKVLPGASEVVLTFDQTSDPLRILITKSGVVKYFWRGQLHNEL